MKLPVSAHLHKKIIILNWIYNIIGELTELFTLKIAISILCTIVLTFKWYSKSSFDVKVFVIAHFVWGGWGAVGNLSVADWSGNWIFRQWIWLKYYYCFIGVFIYTLKYNYCFINQFVREGVKKKTISFGPVRNVISPPPPPVRQKPVFLRNFKRKGVLL